MLTLTELLANLPPEPDEASLFGEIQQAVAESGRKLVVIDDDPTGTQTWYFPPLWRAFVLAHRYAALAVRCFSMTRLNGWRNWRGSSMSGISLVYLKPGTSLDC